MTVVLVANVTYGKLFLATISKTPGIVHMCKCVGWSCSALCTWLSHSCGEGETTAAIDRSQPVHLSERIITSLLPSVFMALGFFTF